MVVQSYEMDLTVTLISYIRHLGCGKVKWLQTTQLVRKELASEFSNCFTLYLSLFYFPRSSYKLQSRQRRGDCVCFLTRGRQGLRRVLTLVQIAQLANAEAVGQIGLSFQACPYPAHITALIQDLVTAGATQGAECVQPLPTLQMQCPSPEHSTLSVSLTAQPLHLQEAAGLWLFQTTFQSLDYAPSTHQTLVHKTPLLSWREALGANTP